MRRRPAMIVGVLVVVVAAGIGAWAWSRPGTTEPSRPDAPTPPAPDEPVIEVAEVVPGTDVPELWGPDELGVTHCEVTQLARRVRYDFDDRSRLVRQRTWRRSRQDEPDDELRPWEVTRWSYGREGMEVERRRASRTLAAEDPYAEAAPGELEWELTETRITHGVQGDWLHQRSVTGDDGEEREALFRIEEGQLTMSSPLRPDEGLPESDHCLFDPGGRPSRFRDPAGEETRWTYDEDGHLAGIEQHPASGEAPTFVPVSVDDRGRLVVLFENFAGDCAEVVFQRCSAVLHVLPGRPLPEGILPGPT